MLPTRMAFRKRKGCEFTELDARFRGRESARVIFAGVDDSPVRNAGCCHSATEVPEETSFARLLLVNGFDGRHSQHMTSEQLRLPRKFSPLRNAARISTALLGNQDTIQFH